MLNETHPFFSTAINLQHKDHVTASASAMNPARGEWQRMEVRKRERDSQPERHAVCS